MKYAVLGYGSRGCAYNELFNNDDRAELVAVCDVRESRIALCKSVNSEKNVRYFSDENDFFGCGKLADLCVISTQDADHARHALRALALGYDLLLEKPVACNEEDCIRIYNAAKQNKRNVFVCHVLRYAPIFNILKQELDSGKYGRVVTTTLTENVVWWHQAHSYVRGNWHDTKKGSPMIIAKCCHDLDLLNWFTGENPVSVSSMGGLSYFTAANAPKNSGADCYHCSAASECIYNCENIYWKNNGAKGNFAWPLDIVIYGVENPTHEQVSAALKASPYCKCVFKCDNDAVDHQVVNVLYDNGATAQLTMTAFSEGGGRAIHVHCERGDIFSSLTGNRLHCRIFDGEEKIIDMNKIEDDAFAHGGGDKRLIEDIIEIYCGNGRSKALTTLDKSLSSHAVGFAAERSRLKGGAVEKVKKFC